MIFRKFSRRAYRKVKDATTDMNTFLSENLSGIKVTQIFNREEQKMQDFLQSVYFGASVTEQSWKKIMQM